MGATGSRRACGALAGPGDGREVASVAAGLAGVSLTSGGATASSDDAGDKSVTSATKRYPWLWSVLMTAGAVRSAWTTLRSLVRERVRAASLTKASGQHCSSSSSLL